MHRFVLEVGTEEMPHTFLLGAMSQLVDRLPGMLSDAGVIFEGLKVMSTPRRLAVIVEGVEEKTRQQQEVVKGPPVAVAYKDGQPTKALLGFLKKYGASPEDTFTYEEGNKRYVMLRLLKGGEDAKEVVTRVVLEALEAVKFPKTMRWGEGRYQFGRPVRWLVALWDDEVVPAEFKGVRSGRVSRGIRVFAGEVEIPSAARYEEVLKEEGMVVVSHGERKAMVRAEVENAARSAGGKADIDEDLLDEVTFLVEYPTAFVGEFDSRFLALPDVVLTTVMAHHQRYFPVRDEEGRLLPAFVGVRNGPSEGMENVIKGAERVVRARFMDAVFFYNEDRKIPLEKWREKTADIPLFEKMGSYLDKSDRVMRLVNIIIDDFIQYQKNVVEGFKGWGVLYDLNKRVAETNIRVFEEERRLALETAKLMWADLPTHMVRELTELHGWIGYEYYKDTDPDVARGILDTLFPLGDRLPKTKYGALVGMLDRLDTVAVAGVAGIKLKGGGDIFGIRRSMLGALQLLMAFFPDLTWRHVAGRVADVVAEFFRADRDEVYSYMTAVAEGRLRSVLSALSPRAYGAVLPGWEDKPFGALYTVGKLIDERFDTDDMKIVSFAHKRIRKIAPAGEYPDVQPDPAEPEEVKLYQAVKGTEDMFKGIRLWDRAGAGKMFGALVELSKRVHRFFDNVLVNHKDPEVRKRRKALLDRAAKIYERVADFGGLGL